MSDTIEEVNERFPSDSIQLKILPFETDVALRENYKDSFGELRFGLILEDLDIMAGVIAYRHSLKNKIDFDKPAKELLKSKFEFPVIIVTASCHNIELSHQLHADRNLEIKGNVIWVGNSSMMVRLTVDSYLNETKDNKQPVLVSYFTMVSRDLNNKAKLVPRLIVRSDEEKLLYNVGNDTSNRRKAQAKISLQLKPPSDQEREIIHEFFVNSAKFSSEEYIKMKDTVCQSTQMMQPQERNIHNKIFGGYTMRQAYDIAFITAYKFSESRPSLQAIADISFLAPLEIGDIVSFTAKVVFATDNLLEIIVAADVTHPKTKTTVTTNVFSFSFHCLGLKKKIIPHSYQECMEFIEGRRKLLKINPDSLVW